jgi:hypothetical protein
MFHEPLYNETLQTGDEMMKSYVLWGYDNRDPSKKFEMQVRAENATDAKKKILKKSAFFITMAVYPL